MHCDFKPFLQRILFQYRNSKQGNKKYSPAELVYGRSLRMPVISSYQQGKQIWFKQKTDGAVIPAMYMMPKDEIRCGYNERRSINFIPSQLIK